MDLKKCFISGLIVGLIVYLSTSMFLIFEIHEKTSRIEKLLTIEPTSSVALPVYSDLKKISIALERESKNRIEIKNDVRLTRPLHGSQSILLDKMPREIYLDKPELINVFLVVSPEIRLVFSGDGFNSHGFVVVKYYDGEIESFNIFFDPPVG